MKRKVCRDCKLFYDKEICPLCKKDAPAVQWQGRIVFTDAKKSFIGQQMGITEDGEYAIKVR